MDRETSMSERALGPTEILLSLLLFVLIVAALFPEISVGGKTISASPHIPYTLPSGPVGMMRTDRHPLMDAYDGWIREANFPYLERAVRAGGMPFWLPHEACGNPFMAGLLHGFFFPPNFLMFVGDPPLGFDLAYLARLLLAGWLMFLFLRVHGLKFPGAFVGGVLFLGCGYLVGGLNLPNACVEVMIPGLLLGFECLLVHRRRRDLALAVGMVALVLVGGNPQAAFLALAFAGLYSVTRILLLPRGVRIKTAVRLAVAHVLGAMLAAPQLLPFLEFFTRAAHTHGAHLNIFSMPWQTSILWVVPEFFRNAYHQPEMASSGGFYGLATLGWILIPICFALPGRQFLVWFTAAMVLLCGAWYFGVPGFTVLNQLPVINQIQIHKYLAVYLCFFPAILAAVGMDHLIRIPARRAAAWLGLSTLGVVLVTAGFVALWYFGRLEHPGSGHLRLGPSDPVAPVLTIVGVLAAAILLICALLYLRPRFRTGVLWVVGILVLAEVAAHVPRDYPPRANAFRPPAFLSRLTGDVHSHRIYSPGKVLYPNTAAIFGLNDIRYADALKIDRYVRLIQEGFSYPDAFNYFPTLSSVRPPGAPPHVLAFLAVRHLLCTGEVIEVGRSPIMGGSRQDILVDLTTDGGDLVGAMEGEVEVSVWVNNPASGRLEAPATLSGKRAETLRLRASESLAGKFVYLGFEVPVGGFLEIESVVWDGRRIPAADLDRGSHNWEAVSTGPPLRVKATTLVALPPVGPGSSPDLVLRGRTSGKAVQIRLVTVESRLLQRFSCRGQNGAGTGRRFRVDLASFAGSKVPLCVVASGEGRIASLGFEPDVFTEKGNFGTIRLYEHRRALPRAFGVYRAEITPDEEAQLKKVLDPKFPIREKVVVAGLPGGLTLPDPPPAGSPRVTWREVDPAGSRIVLETEFASDGLLVLHDNDYPGWCAYVNGAPADLVRANY